MRVLITTFPGHGHLGPLIPLATAIRDAGHDVAIATSSTFRDWVQSHGLSHESCGPAWRESDFGRPLHQSHLLADLGHFIETAVNAKVIADVRSIVARTRPDIILSNDYEPCGRIVAEETGVPFALASSGPRIPRAVQERFQGFVLRKAREAAGAALAEGHELDYSLKWLRLHFCPPSHAWWPVGESEPSEAPNQFGIRPESVEIGAPFCPPQSSQDTRPTALCTFGTVFNKDPEVLRLVIEAIAPSVRRFYVLPGPGLDVASFAGLRPGVEFLGEVGLSTILPHVDYVVTHGGTATLVAAQLAGKPCLLLPRGADQILNGGACQRSRISVVRFHTMAASAVGVHPIVPMTVESVANAFSELVTDPGYRERALRFRNELEALPPMHVAVRLLEQLASTRAPVVKRT
jgi:UDP:flavonoid glycosyltransferase YjiC (YdhE family)